MFTQWGSGVHLGSVMLFRVGGIELNMMKNKNCENSLFTPKSLLLERQAAHEEMSKLASRGV